MSIGIPFAFTTLNGELVCPVCAAKIPETYDVVGERTSNNYAAHYEEKHAGVAGRSSDRRHDETPPCLYRRYTVSLTVRVPAAGPLQSGDVRDLIIAALDVGLDGAGQEIAPGDVELSFVDDAESPE